MTDALAPEFTWGYHCELGRSDKVYLIVIAQDREYPLDHYVFCHWGSRRSGMSKPLPNRTVAGPMTLMVAGRAADKARSDRVKHGYTKVIALSDPSWGMASSYASILRGEWMPDSITQKRSARTPVTSSEPEPSEALGAPQPALPSGRSVKKQRELNV
jgi:hypothetical protein